MRNVPYRILIADDHVIVRRMLKVLVETHPGWNVCGEAENGQEALDKVTQLRPDVVILDMAMPVKDGITAAREISASMPEVRIVMHTLHYSEALELEAKKAGVQRVIAKVDSSDALLKAIEEVLADGSSGNLGPADPLASPLKIAAAAANGEEQKETPGASPDKKQREN